jgi:Protein of unknown function (DUF2846)
MLMRNVSYIVAIWTAILLAGCSSNAPPLNNLLSKDLKPPIDAALVYIMRPYKYFGVLRSPDFSFNGTKIGEIENNRYMYFYAYPMELILGKVVDGNTEQLKIKTEAGKKYFLKFDMREGYSQLSQQEGMKYLRELNMGGNFKPVVIGTKPSNSPMPSSNQATNLEVRQKDYLKYDDNSRTGVIKYAVDIEKRDVVIEKIEEVCNTKNIALYAYEKKEGGATYKTLDESIENNIIEIKFQCLY